MIRALVYILAIFCLISSATQADSKIKRIDKIQGGNTIVRHFLYNPVGFWKFEEGSGATAIDLSGSGNHGTITGATWATGKIGGGLNFDGNDKLNLNTYTSFDWTKDDSFSICCWTKWGGTTGINQVIIGRDDPSTNLHIWLGYGNATGEIYFNLYDLSGNGTTIRSLSSQADGNWHHVVCVRNGETDKVILCVDGQTKQEATYNYLNGFSGTVAVNIGWLNLEPGFYCKGVLDDVRIYHRALTADEVKRLYFLGQQ